MTLTSILLLFLPLIWEVFNDSDGEAKHRKVFSVIIRVIIAAAVSVIGWVLINKPIIDGFILSLSIHFFLFDYIIHWILIAGGIVEPRNGETWWSYIGSTAVTDRLRVWSNWGAWTRFWIRLGVLIAAISIYIF